MTTLRLVGDWHPSVAVGLALVLAALAFWLYRRETSDAGLGGIGWLLPSLRSLAVFLIALTLAEPVIESRVREGDPGKLTFLIDSSKSMSVSDPAADLNGEAEAVASRFDVAAEKLVGENGLLNGLKDDFEITVASFDGDQLRDLWSSNVNRSMPVPSLTKAWVPENWSDYSPIGNALQQVESRGTLSNASDNADASVQSSTGSVTRSVVLMSDGQSNFGSSPLAAAEQLGQLGVHVFSVGLGPYEEPADLAIRQVIVPQRVYRTDNLHGKFLVSEQQSRGRRYSIQIEHQSHVIWEESFVASGDAQREIDFSTPVGPIFARASDALPNEAEYASLPVKLTTRLRVEGGEVNGENNLRDCHFVVASQKSRLLLIDGRSRWETRYLKNMFARDPAWQIESIILSERRERGTSSAGLPPSREDLFQYDLVILGDVEGGAIDRDMLEWLREFVELAGGGLILIDGARQHLRAEAFEPLHRLSPVRWLADSDTNRGSAADKSFQANLTLPGKGLPALSLVAADTPSGNAILLAVSELNDNSDLWAKLPALQFVSSVEALPGSEVLVEAVSERERRPLMVERRYGAGRVLFLATDETWRWRYRVADLVHGRLWNQLARWVMKTPMSLHGEFVSLDAGAASYIQGQPVEVRCQLREMDGRPATGRSADALLYRANQVVMRIPLTEDTVPGSYAARIDALPAGDYQMQIAAVGFSTQALELRSEFTVTAAAGEEMQRIVCNEPLLRAIAAKTDGEYVRESDSKRLEELLEPMSAGKIRHTATLLWQSYWWFTAALLLLVAEWLIRKRVGLV